MALDRFTNKDEIMDTNGPVKGIVWSEEDIPLLELDSSFISPKEKPYIELHAYTPSGDYIGGGTTTAFEQQGNNLYIDYYQGLNDLEITRGLFEVVVNVHKIILDDPENPNLFIKEISPDRREVRLTYNVSSDTTQEETGEIVSEYLNKFGRESYFEPIFDDDGNEVGQVERPISQDLALNLGKNRVYKIINQKEWGESNEFVVRLYSPLPATINEKMKLWIVEELSDSFIDNIDLNLTPVAPKTNDMAGPNWEAGEDYSTITETNFRNWNDLLATNTATAQQIIDRIFSGSFGVGPSYEGANNYVSAPAIDYSGYQNWVHFSSAKERVINFKYKLQLVEYYEKEIAKLNNAIGSDTGSLQGSINKNETAKNTLIGGFDGFERWAFYEQTSSLFSHFAEYDKPGVNVRSNGGFIGAQGYTLQPFPKFISDGKLVRHHSTSSIAESWYNGTFSSASLYDDENNNQLRNSIPSHIQEDENNSQYVMFIDMISQHFDILYSYIKALTIVPIGEEHPKLGVNKQLLYDAAKGMGWQLTNGKQASQLWQYVLGVSGSGEYKTTGTLFSKSDEDITTEVWRRIVNNLPYLLKSKGSARGIKALLNTYGIPQSMLSIREYGGPKVSGDAPALIEDRFSYALQFKSGSIGTKSPYIQFNPRNYTTNLDTWGFVRDGLASGADIPAQTREFRFKPAVKESMIIYSGITEHQGDPNDARAQFHIAVDYTSSYSGSDQYGRLVVSHGSTAASAMTASTEYLPLYDGDFWNVRWFWTATGSGAGTYNEQDNLNTTYHLQTQKASDYITGKIIHQSSASYTPTNKDHRNTWNGITFSNNNRIHRLGGFPGVGSQADGTVVNRFLNRFIAKDNSLGGGSATLPTIKTFSGSIQEFREYLEDIGQEAFDFHTLNPTSYVSGLNATASFDTLVRHYPLGTDLNAVDHSLAQYRVLSSSHPAQNFVDVQLPYHTDVHDRIVSGSSFATMSNFPAAENAQRGNYEPVEETYFIQGISLGGNNPRSQKIRIENNELIRPLSVTGTGEKSSFDNAPLDSNRLGLFYSMADQINKEIFNHVGDVELDDFVGDPSHQFENSYPDLSAFSQNYWKKYTRQNDINAYIRVFSLFDFSLFKQIAQLLPARVDLAKGLLVEPHALERAKVKVMNQPVKSEPMFTSSIQYMDIFANTNPAGDALMTGSVSNITASIAMPHKDLQVTTVNVVSESGYFQNEFTAYIPRSGSKDENGNNLSSVAVRDGNPFNGTVYKHISINFPYKVDQTAATAASLPFEVTMSQNILNIGVTGSIILDQRLSIEGEEVQINHFHSTSLALTKKQNTALRVTSQSLGQYYSQSFITADNRTLYANIDNQRYAGSKLSAPGVNQPSQIVALDFLPIIQVFEVNANKLIYSGDQKVGNLDVR